MKTDKNKRKLITDFYMWMIENDYDHNIRIRVENKAELFLRDQIENVKKDKYGKTAQTANTDVCMKCKYFKIEMSSEICRHCIDNLDYNEFYVKE